MKTNGRLIGEFLLIVIGVLVALAVETAFEDRRDAEQRDDYLVRLKSDLESDKLAIERRIQFFTAVQQFSNDTLRWLESDDPVDQQVLLAAFYAAEVFPFLPTRDTYEDLNNTGNIRLIDDIDLRTRLAAYYNKADQSNSAWTPSEDYRAIIRGIIPPEVQHGIREHCPTTDSLDEVPTGFPPCQLPGVDYEKMTALLRPLKDDVELLRILTYRESSLAVVVYLLTQQKMFASVALDDLEKAAAALQR